MRGRGVAWTILRRSGRRDLSSNLSDPTIYSFCEVCRLTGEESYFKGKYTKYEKARIIGARALQIAMGAPVLIETNETDPIENAIMEFNLGVIPITVRRRKH